MRLIIKSVNIVWEYSDFHHQKVDILVEDGLIKAIESNLENSDIPAWFQPDTYLSAGWFDLDANFGEPGFETRENLESGSAAALKGGFTGLALMPNTSPPLHSRTEIEYILNKSRDLSVDLFPLGCISKNKEGKEMAELFDMYQAGALAFIDGDRPVQNAGLLLRALQYTSSFGGKVFSYPEDHSLAGQAQVNEGITSLRLGMKGIPNIAEELIVKRDLMLATYTDKPIHFIAISAAGSVELIREAKKRGQPVTASVPAYQLFLNDEALVGFDTNYKLRPPLRGNEDREALITGIQDGTIDAITSRHTPQEIEAKAVEFENAYDGMISLENSFSLANKILETRVSIDRLIDAFSTRPRNILGVSQPKLKVGEMANFCWFNPTEEWILTKESLLSKAVNTPFLGEKMKGKVLGVVHKNRIKQF